MDCRIRSIGLKSEDDAEQVVAPDRRNVWRDGKSSGRRVNSVRYAGHVCMLPREDIVGHRITNIVGDSTSSDDSFNFTDFIYVLDNGIALRMPYDDESGDYLPIASLTQNHRPLVWPKSRKKHFNDNLWAATIADILIPLDPEERFLDSGAIKLSSGHFIAQLCGAPHGILPSVDILAEIGNAGAMVSVWDAISRNQQNN
jgi:hypothetical protein